MGSNNGTGWPLTLRCTKCKRGRDWRNSTDDGTYLIRTGRTKPYRGGNRGARGLGTFHEYACITCGHIGWSRHSEIARKPLAHYVEIVETKTGKVDKRMGPMLESKAEKVERGVLMRINDDFHVRTGTAEALEKEAQNLSMKEIGARIDAHLKRFEADPKINVDRSPTKTGLHDYYNAGAGGHGRFVYVQYVAYQGNSTLSKADALKYLAWLDAGNVGRHFGALR